MIGTRWMTLVGAAAVSAIAPPRAGWAAPVPLAPIHPCVLLLQVLEPSPDNEEARDVTARDLQRLAATLADPTAPPTVREEAARRLVTRQTTAARRVLGDALIDAGNPGAQLAAARALAEDPRPDPSLVTSLFSVLGTSPAITDAAARALGNYRDQPEVLTQMLTIAEGRNRPVDVRTRAAVIRALGLIPERRAAEALVALLRQESVTIRNAAADGLVALTGLADYGSDVAHWSRWWEANGPKSPAQFRAEIEARKAAAFDRQQQRLGQLALELESILRERYQAAPDNEKDGILLRYLAGSEPEVRLVGVRIISDEFSAATRGIAGPVREKLRQMIGDSSPVARRETAYLLSRLNEPEALEDLLVQLAQETDASVKAAIATALGPIADLRAVEPLLALLNDPSPAIARAAAMSLGDREKLGTKIAQDPALAARTARALFEVFTRADGPQAQDLRAAAATAMIYLKQPDVLREMVRLGALDPRSPLSSIQVRRAIIRAFREAGDRRASDIIVGALSDEPGVRLEAVQALQIIGAHEQAEVIGRMLRNPPEDDPKIREAAWQALESFFPDLPVEQLNIWADRMRADPNREITVLNVLIQRLIKDGDPGSNLPTFRQRIGEAYMKVDRPEDAVVHFQAALDARLQQRQSAPPVVIESLSRSLLQSLLQAGRYGQAVTFATTSIARDPGLRPIMGSLIAGEVDRLVRKGDATNAQKLIDEAMKMTPPNDLPDQHLRDLQDAQAKLRAGAPRGSLAPRSTASRGPATVDGR